MATHVELPPLVAPGPAPAPASRPPVPLAAVVAVVALTVTAIAIGWGFTQWSSAGDWRHRSEAIESQFDKLEARVERAEARMAAAQRASAKNRKQLTAAETRLTELANQESFAHDMKVEFCEAHPGSLPPDVQARIC